LVFFRLRRIFGWSLLFLRNTLVFLPARVTLPFRPISLGIRPLISPPGITESPEVNRVSLPCAPIFFSEKKSVSPSLFFLSPHFIPVPSLRFRFIGGCHPRKFYRTPAVRAFLELSSFRRGPAVPSDSHCCAVPGCPLLARNRAESGTTATFLRPLPGSWVIMHLNLYSLFLSLLSGVLRVTLMASSRVFLLGGVCLNLLRFSAEVSSFESRLITRLLS